MLAIAVVEAVLEERLRCLDSLYPGVAPIDTLSHQGTVCLVFIVGAELNCSLPVQLPIDLSFGVGRVLLDEVGAACLLNLLVVRTPQVVETVLAEEHIGAFTFTAQFFSVDAVGRR